MSVGSHHRLAFEEETQPSDALLKMSFEHDNRARFVLDSNDCLQLANALARDLIESRRLFVNEAGYFHFPSPLSQKAFDLALNNARQTAPHWHRKVMRLIDSEWCTLHIRTLSGTAFNTELIVRPVCDKADHDIAPVACAFGLTAMEAKVLLGLTQAACPKTIAHANTISVHTVRAHIRGIFGKMGTRNIAATQSFVLDLLH